MKKIIVLAMVAAFMVFAGTASADENWYGTLMVDSIIVCESDCATDVPVAPCDLLINWTFNSGQGPYLLPATACGTLLNVALLKVWNEQLVVNAALTSRLVPCIGECGPTGSYTFELEIDCIEFGSRAFPL